MANGFLGCVSHGGCSTPFSRQFSISENSNSRANAVRFKRVGSVATDDERSLILQMLKGERRERGDACDAAPAMMELFCESVLSAVHRERMADKVSTTVGRSRRKLH